MVALHAMVESLAEDIELEGGILRLGDEAFVRFSRRVAKLRGLEERKTVLIGVMALAARLLREGQDAAMPVVSATVPNSPSGSNPSRPTCHESPVRVWNRTMWSS